MQQYLPFTVLKHKKWIAPEDMVPFQVATVLTVYGIETTLHFKTFNGQRFVATVLTVYGIETGDYRCIKLKQFEPGCNSTYRLRY